MAEDFGVDLDRPGDRTGPGNNLSEQRFRNSSGLRVLIHDPGGGGKIQPPAARKQKFLDGQAGLALTI